MKTSKIRIIGGSLKGNHISFPSSSKLRPTSNKLREILFNWLSFEIAGLKCADCFSGSGALGIEAISRGAKSVTFIEKTPKFAASIEANLGRLNISERCQIEIKNADALFISCTALPVLNIIERLEKELGKPVITSNQSLIWDTLESIGMNKDIQGFGKLFNLDQ